MANNNKGMTVFLNEVRMLFPGDDAKVQRFFAASLIQEANGDHAKANEYLAKAIAAEAETATA